MRARHLLVVAMLGLSLSVPARADDVEQAKVLFSAGAAAYDKRDYLAAIQAFQAAQKLAARPAIVFSLAQAHRRQYYVDNGPSHLRAAVDLFREYEKEVPHGGRRVDAAQALQELGPAYDRLGAATPEETEHKTPPSISVNSSGTPGARIALDGGPPVEAPLIGPVSAGKHHVVISADGFIDEARDVTAVDGSIVAIDVPLREKPALVTLGGVSGARVEVDGRDVGTTPLHKPVELSSGTHLVAVLKNGRDPYVREIDVTRGEKRALDASPPASRQRKVAVVTLIGSGVALVAGGAFLGVAMAEEGQALGIRDAMTTRAITPQEQSDYQSARSARDSWTVASIVGFGTGGLLALTGAALFLFDTPSATGPAVRDEMRPPAPKKAEPHDIVFAPLLGPGVVGGAARLTF